MMKSLFLAAVLPATQPTLQFGALSTVALDLHKGLSKLVAPSIEQPEGFGDAILTYSAQVEDSVISCVVQQNPFSRAPIPKLKGCSITEESAGPDVVKVTVYELFQAMQDPPLAPIEPLPCQTRSCF
jgi:hypothetical protein